MLLIAFALFAVTGISHVVFGIIYVSADEFMPYHAQALSVEWSRLDANYQTLLLALIKLAGAGGLVAGIVNLSLVAHLYRHTRSKLLWLLPISALTFQVPMHYVVYSVHASTPGEPPLAAVSVGTIALVCAAVLLFVGRSRNQT